MIFRLKRGGKDLKIWLIVEDTRCLTTIIVSFSKLFVANFY
jgi:hypothetical protein